MAYRARHRTARSPRPVMRRASGVAVGGALALGALGVSAPMASAYDASVWDRVAACESGGNWSTSTGNGFYGGLQFYQPTWRGYGGQAYAGYAHQASKSEQIAIARRVLYAQGPGAWPVCSVRAGLTRSNGGADPNATPGGGGGSAPAPAPDPGTEVTRYVSATTAANVRSGPGTGYRIVARSARGTQVTGILSGGWLRIGEGRYIGSAVLSSTPVGGGGTPAPAPSPDPGTQVTRYISATTAANVRSGPSTSYAVVGRSARGTQITGTLRGGWLRIGDGRWVGPEVLSTTPVGGGSSPAPAPAPGDVTRYVSANYAAYVRSGPGMSYGVVAKSPRGTKVTGQLVGGWLKIADGRYIGSSVLSTTPVR